MLALMITHFDVSAFSAFPMRVSQSPIFDWVASSSLRVNELVPFLDLIKFLSGCIGDSFLLGLVLL